MDQKLELMEKRMMNKELEQKKESQLYKRRAFKRMSTINNLNIVGSF